MRAVPAGVPRVEVAPRDHLFLLPLVVSWSSRSPSQPLLDGASIRLTSVVESGEVVRWSAGGVCLRLPSRRPVHRLLTVGLVGARVWNPHRSRLTAAGRRFRSTPLRRIDGGGMSPDSAARARL